MKKFCNPWLRGIMDASQGSRKAFLLVLLVFALGIALGAVGTYVVTTRVLAARPQVNTVPNRVALFTRDLNLNADQQKQIQEILTETRARYAEIHSQADPEYEKARHEGRQKIRQILTPEQRPKFEDMLRRFDEERRSRQNEAHD
jgi:Spy/CpxP family protein refolding chaperone